MLARLGVIGLALGLAACGGEEPEPVPEAVDRPVKLFDVISLNESRVLNLPALIEAGQSSDVAFEMPGRIVRIAVDKGDEVAEGDVLAELDAEAVRNQLIEAQNMYESAQDAFRRAEMLVDEGAIARGVYEQRRTQRNQAKARLDTAREQLADTVLRAPFDGIVALRHVDAFEYVAPQQPVLSVQSQSPAKAVVEIPASLVAGLGEVESERAVVILDSRNDIRIPAELGAVSTQADRATLTYETEFLFEPPEGVIILPGMTATLRVEATSENIDASERVPPIIPLAAVTLVDEQTHVWIYDPQTNEVSPRAIEVGNGVGPYVPVTNGLEVGEVVVTAGITHLHEGMRVRPYERD